jgi:large subunit ribosomal protein L10
MRAEKTNIGRDYLARLNTSPFFVLVDYKGLRVSHFAELRKRLTKVGAELHVIKNSIFRIAAREVGVSELGTGFSGQLAVVTGQSDFAAAAKAVKSFLAEFQRPSIRFGYLNSQRLEASEILALADLPSIEVLRSKIMAMVLTPATQLVRLISTPGSRIARVIKARVDQAQAS